jgi:hypothetical protein
MSVGETREKEHLNRPFSRRIRAVPNRPGATKTSYTYVSFNGKKRGADLRCGKLWVLWVNNHIRSMTLDSDEEIDKL